MHVGVCLPGSSPCGDGENCFNDNLRCDLKQDCLLTGADERSCGKFYVSGFCYVVFC